MTNGITKTQFDWVSAILCARMVSLNEETRKQAAKDASALLEKLPDYLREAPFCKDEIEALKTFIERVDEEHNHGT